MSFRIKSLVVAVIPVITLSCSDSTSPVNALPATLEISLSATGDEVSPDGFTFDILLAGSSAPIPGTVHQNGSTKFSGLPPGEYVIVMKALPLERLGCVGVSPLAQSVSLVAGGVASVAFRIACVRVPELAVVLEHAPYGTELGIVKAAQRIQITAYEGLVAEPAWSPDGTKIAFVRQADTAAIFINNADTDEIDVMDADGGDLLRLTNGTHPAWSPDGKRIAFTRGDSASAIFVVNAAGGPETQLTPKQVYADPAWSPDGASMAFADRSDGGIWILTLADSQLRKISAGRDDADPAWSPDGTLIAFEREGTIFLMKPDGSSARPLTSLWPARHPSWSPDSRRIAFDGRNCDPFPDINCELTVYIIGMDGMPIKESWAYASQPSWRPR